MVNGQNEHFELKLVVKSWLPYEYEISLRLSLKDSAVKPRYNTGRGRKNFEAKNRVIARSVL